MNKEQHLSFDGQLRQQNSILPPDKEIDDQIDEKAQRLIDDGENSSSEEDLPPNNDALLPKEG